MVCGNFIGSSIKAEKSVNKDVYFPGGLVQAASLLYKSQFTFNKQLQALETVGMRHSCGYEGMLSAPAQCCPRPQPGAGLQLS